MRIRMCQKKYALYKMFVVHIPPYEIIFGDSVHAHANADSVFERMCSAHLYVNKSGVAWSEVWRGHGLNMYLICFGFGYDDSI